MIAIHFRKARAEHYIDCLANAKPIEGVVNQFDFLALAGACYAAAFSHGPASRNPEELKKLPGETREAIDVGWRDDLFAAIEFYSILTLMVVDGAYEEEGFAPECRALVTLRDGQRTIVPAEGMPSD